MRIATPEGTYVCAGLSITNFASSNRSITSRFSGKAGLIVSLSGLCERFLSCTKRTIQKPYA